MKCQFFIPDKETKYDIITNENEHNKVKQKLLELKIK